MACRMAAWRWKLFSKPCPPQTGAARKVEIERQLLDYCALDTYAMVRLWSAFTGKAVS